MRAEIISIGTEIMLGEITDTNASFIARELPQYGVDQLYVSQTGDNPGRMQEIFERAWGRSDIIFTTGGLGPTEDDITRETVAATLGEEMTLDAEQERILRAIMERGGRPMPERNLKQAMLIPSCRAIPNPRGTAPGWWVERDGRRLVVMPGPPAEGREAVEAALKGVAALNSRGWEIVHQAAIGDVVLNERIDRWDAGGKTVELPLCGVFELRDGKIAVWRDYFAMATFTRIMS